MIKPAQGGIGQGFSNAHQAVDIGGREHFGTPIIAPHSGTITAAEQMGSGTSDAGLAIDITSSDGIYKSRLAHNDRILVSVGQRVDAGEQVGTQGYTGYTVPDNTIGGTHCHWVLWKSGVRVNGLDYLNEEGGDMALDIRDAREIYRVGLFREPENEEVLKNLLGKKFSDVAVGVKDSKEWLGLNHIIRVAYPSALIELKNAQDRIKELEAQNNAGTKPTKLEPGLYQVPEIT